MTYMTDEASKVEAVFNLALEALTRDMRGPARVHGGALDASDVYQMLCARELVRGMVSARLLAEALPNAAQKDAICRLSNTMMDALADLYPSLGLSVNAEEAMEELDKMRSVSGWKIHTRILSMLMPSKRERPFPFPLWPASQFRAA